MIRWERTGEYRAPKNGEPYEHGASGEPVLALGDFPENTDRWILRRIAEEEKPQPASEGEMYRTSQEVLEAIETEWDVVLPSSLRRLIIKKVSRHRPPCTCNVEAAVREAVKAEREACAKECEWIASLVNVEEDHVAKRAAAVIRARGTR